MASQFRYCNRWPCIRGLALYAPGGIGLASQKGNTVFFRLLVIAFIFLGLTRSADTATLSADPGAKRDEPGYYLSLVSRLEPGDELYLPGGTYGSGLDLTGLRGRSGAWITVIGPASGEPAVVTSGSDCCNVVQLDNSAFLALMNLTIDSAGRDSVDGVNAKGHPTHDILIQGCTLLGQGAHQGTIGISTKSPAWNWTIRENRVYRAGTGLYLGNSNGEAPFIAGVIEGNLIVDSIGYNLQIKHQNAYNDTPWLEKLPNGPRRTSIRHNFFGKTIKDRPSAKKTGARPSVLVGTFPDEGPGSADYYHIHRNVFFRNPEESLRK